MGERPSKSTANGFLLRGGALHPLLFSVLGFHFCSNLCRSGQCATLQRSALAEKSSTDFSSLQGSGIRVEEKAELSAEAEDD